MSWEDEIKKIDEGDRYVMRATNMSNNGMVHFKNLVDDLKKWMRENPSYKEDGEILEVLKTYYESLGAGQEALFTFFETVMTQWEAS
jgi:hypothetical protein